MKLKYISFYLFVGAGLFLLTSQAAYADDMGLGMCLFAGLFYGSALLAGVGLIEAAIIARAARMKFSKAFGVSVLINVISVIVGIPIFWFIGPNSIVPLIIYSIFIACIAGLHSLIVRSKYIALISIPCMVIGIFGLLNLQTVSSFRFPVDLMIYLLVLIYCLGSTVAIEVWPARFFIPLKDVDRVIVKANVVSYIVILVVGGGYELLETLLVRS